MRSSDTKIKYPRNTNGMWPKPMIGGLWISLFQRWFKPVNIRCCIQEGNLQTFRMLDYLSSFLPIERKHLGNFWGKFPTGCAVPAFPVTRLCRLLLPLSIYCSHYTAPTVILPLVCSHCSAPTILLSLYEVQGLDPFHCPSFTYSSEWYLTELPLAAWVALLCVELYPEWCWAEWKSKKWVDFWSKSQTDLNITI